MNHEHWMFVFRILWVLLVGYYFWGSWKMHSSAVEEINYNKLPTSEKDLAKLSEVLQFTILALYHAIFFLLPIVFDMGWWSIAYVIGYSICFLALSLFLPRFQRSRPEQVAQGVH